MTAPSQDHSCPDWLAGIMVRDLSAMRRELAAYDEASDVWSVPDGVVNPAGTLALHVAGNLQHYVGAVLGDTGYVRDRAAEFGRRDLTVAGLDAELERAAQVVSRVIPGLSSAAWTGPYPIPLAGRVVATGDFLFHLSTHLAYHLGQIDYHRRLVTGRGTTVGAVDIASLSSAVLEGDG